MNQTGDPRPRFAADGNKPFGDLWQKFPPFLWYALLVELEARVLWGITSTRGQVAGTEQAAGVADVVEGRQEAELDLTLGQLRRCCGALSPEQEPRIRAWPLPQLEALAEALLDFQGTADLRSWLKAEGWGLRAEESRVWGSIPPARSTAGSHRSQNRSGRDCAPLAG